MGEGGWGGGYKWQLRTSARACAEFTPCSAESTTDCYRDKNLSPLGVKCFGRL